MSLSKNKLKFDQYIFLLGIYFKQFYILPSGNIQTSDILMMLSSLWLLLFRKERKIYIRKEEILFLAYFLAIFLINIFYVMHDGTNAYLKAIMFYLFNTIIVLEFSYYLHFDNNGEEFLKSFFIVIKLSLITQLLIFLSGLGKWYSNSRYEGTFNDPNQYGVFIFFLVLLSYYFGTIFNLKKNLYIIIGILLILPSTSTGMMSGIIVFIFSCFICKFIKERNKKATWIMSLLLVLIIFFIMMNARLVRLPESISNNPMFVRFSSKLDNLFSQSSSESNVLSDRGWTRIIEHPYYLLFGAGEGNFERFNVQIEIHSSFLGPLFYYGTIPFIIFLLWVKSNITKIDSLLICVYLSLAFESMFLINTRQPLFWIIILLGSYSLSKKQLVKTNEI